MELSAYVVRPPRLKCSARLADDPRMTRKHEEASGSLDWWLRLSAIICAFAGLGAVLLQVQSNRTQSTWFSDRAFELQAQEWADGIEKQLSEGRGNTYAVSASEELFAKWGVDHHRLEWVMKKPHRLIGLKRTIAPNAQ